MGGQAQTNNKFSKDFAFSLYLRGLYLVDKSGAQVKHKSALWIRRSDPAHGWMPSPSFGNDLVLFPESWCCCRTGRRSSRRNYEEGSKVDDQWRVGTHTDVPQTRMTDTDVPQTRMTDTDVLQQRISPLFHSMPNYFCLVCHFIGCLISKNFRIQSVSVFSRP